jgi:hypothetical protein
MKALIKIFCFFMFMILSVNASALTQTRTAGSYNDDGGNDEFTDNLLPNVGGINNTGDISEVISDGKKMKGYFEGFNFAIPAGAVVTDVEIILRASWVSTKTMKEFKYEVHADGLTAYKVANNTATFPKNVGFTTHNLTGDNVGGAGKIFDSADAAWTPDAINSSDGGNGIRIYLKHVKADANNSTISFDYVAITVTYSGPCIPCY